MSQTEKIRQLVANTTEILASDVTVGMVLVGAKTGTPQVVESIQRAGGTTALKMECIKARRTYGPGETVLLRNA